MQANCKYSEVLQAIQPLTDELCGLEESLEAGAARLQACEAELAELNDRKGELQKNLSRRTEEAADLKVSFASLAMSTYLCTRTLQRVVCREILVGNWPACNEFV